MVNIRGDERRLGLYPQAAASDVEKHDRDDDDEPDETHGGPPFKSLSQLPAAYASRSSALFVVGSEAAVKVRMLERIC